MTIVENSGKAKLKTGFTTGTSATAAAKAAGISEQHEIRIAAFDNRGAIVCEADDISVSV